MQAKLTYTTVKGEQVIIATAKLPNGKQARGAGKDDEAALASLRLAVKSAEEHAALKAQYPKTVDLFAAKPAAATKARKKSASANQS